MGFFPLIAPGLTTASYWWMGLGGALGLFVCVLLHELGHALVARRYGLEMGGITLFIFGGVAEMNDEPPSAEAEFFVAIGGPIVTLALVVLFAVGLAAPLPQGVAAVIVYLVLVNTLLLVFNAIPAFPLDGGRVLRALLWKWKNSLRWATNICSSLGSGFGALLIGLAVVFLFVGNFIGAMWWFLLGLFLRGAAQSSYQQVLVRQVLHGEPVRRFMTREPITVTPDTTVEQLVEDYVYRHHFKMLPVTEDDRLVGCVSTRQIKAVPREEWSRRTVADIAEHCGTENTLRPDDDAMDALTKMSRADVSRAMVVEDGRLAGILSLRDLLAFLSLKLELESEEAGTGESVAKEMAPQRSAA